MHSPFNTETNFNALIKIMQAALNLFFNDVQSWLTALVKKLDLQDTFSCHFMQGYLTADMVPSQKEKTTSLHQNFEGASVQRQQRNQTLFAAAEKEDSPTLVGPPGRPALMWATLSASICLIKPAQYTFRFLCIQVLATGK
jgi:hypothetical protein